MSGKKVITIKVPVVPFAIPVAVPMPVEESAETKRDLHAIKKKKKHDRHKKKKHSHVGERLALFREIFNGTLRCLCLWQTVYEIIYFPEGS